MAKRKMYKNVPGFDDYLVTAYCAEHKTMREIASDLGCSPATVLHQLRRLGISTRARTDYEATDRMREHMRTLGLQCTGRLLTAEQKTAISKAHKGLRKRTDYEFGGHEKVRTDGYIKVYVPDHPNASADGYVMKHRLVMERKIGRYLREGEEVHHINHNRADNRLDNLALMSKADHMALHMRERHEKRRNEKCLTVQF